MCYVYTYILIYFSHKSNTDYHPNVVVFYRFLIRFGYINIILGAFILRYGSEHGDRLKGILDIGQGAILIFFPLAVIVKGTKYWFQYSVKGKQFYHMYKI